MKKQPTARTRYSDRVRVQLLIPEDEKIHVKSEFADECDINNIMARYRKTGVLPDSARAAAARFGDFSDIPTYLEMQERVFAAEELFMALPAAVRDQFDNDPGKFLAASETKEGVELMTKLGLGNTPPASDPLPGDPLGAGQAPEAGTEPAGAPKRGSTSTEKVD